MNPLSPPLSSDPAAPRKVLVVDDDDAVRHGLEEVLRMEGYDVRLACNGVQALATLRREPCDLAVLDINMPILNGWGTIGELRRLNRLLPIVIITARPDQGTLATEAGVEIMEKPLDLDRLLQFMKTTLERPAELEPTDSRAD